MNKFKSSTIKMLLMFLMLGIVFTSCKTVLVPQYVKVENISKLQVGMDKTAVLSQLENTYPSDILNGTGECEIHEYLYLKPHRSLFNISNVLSREELTSGTEKYNGESKAIIIFRDQKLATVYTDGGIDEVASLLTVHNNIDEECENETTITKGCMDPMSLSYDPDALEDDGSCEYCECGFVVNPAYNDKRPISECNARCIDQDLIDENGNILSKKNTEVEEGKQCDECDLIDAIKGSGATINIEMIVD
jgi:hypothetical protein